MDPIAMSPIMTQPKFNKLVVLAVRH